MRNLIFFMHTSLDGFVAGLNGEMDWINLDEAMFDFVATMTEQADTALYGRVTYDMMQSYWPTAGEKALEFTPRNQCSSITRLKRSL